MLNLMLFISFLGSWKFILFLNILILLKLKLSKTNLLIIISSLSNLFIVEPLKILIKEPRPPNLLETSYSFPSGHAYSAVAFYCLLTYLLYKRYKSKYIQFIGIFFILLIAYSRLYLGVHYLHDVLAGLFLGIFWLIFCIKYIHVKPNNQV